MLTQEQTVSFISGALAGFCVDLMLYPLDTVKTRLQSTTKTVMRRNLCLFAGLPAVIFGSAPSAALFFCAYEITKTKINHLGSPTCISPIVAACVGELVACVVRVPCETIKQRAQNKPYAGIMVVLSETIRSEGASGLYRGFFSTLLREIPFSFIQYPVWEALKRYIEKRNRSSNHSRFPQREPHLTKGEFALCGGLAGAFAGACTTPFDVIKTRIMLAEKGSAFSTNNVLKVLHLIYSQAGIRGLFAGFIPRVSLLTIGGSIFLGLYDINRTLLRRAYDQNYT